MTPRKNKLQVVRASQIAPPLPGADLQHAWFEVVRHRNWSSLGVLPVDGDIDPIAVAGGFAQMAAQEPQATVLLVNARVAEAMPGRVGPESMDEVWATVAGAALGDAMPYDMIDLSRLPLPQAERALSFAPKMMEYLADEGRHYSVAIFGMDSPLSQTRVIPLARSLDRIVLCIRPGKTRLDQAERVISIVGRERVSGVIIVR